MKNILISLLLAFVVMVGAASASLTANDVSVTLKEGAIDTAILTITTTSEITDISFSMPDISGTNTGFILDDTRWGYAPNTIAVLNGTQNVTLTLTLGPEVVDTYTGDLTINFKDNGTDDSALVNVNVVVQESGTPNPGATVSLPTKVELGSKSQGREKDITYVFTVKNTGTDLLTGIEFSTTLLNEDFNVRFQNVPPSLASTIEAQVTMVVYVPGDLDAGVLIGQSLIFKSNEIAQQSAPLTIETENNLEFKSIEIKVIHADGDSDTTKDLEDDNSPEVDEDVKPGDEIEVEIIIENVGDVDIDDVKVTIENNDELDVDKDDEQNINDDDKETYEFSFTIDDDADDGTEFLTITVEGEDDNGAEHTLEIKVEFNIEVDDEDVTIRSMDVFPRIVQCEGNLRLDVDIKNIGADDLDDAAVRIEIPQLDIIQWEDDIEVDTRDTETASFNIPINEGTPTGRYFIEVEAFWERGSDNKKTDDDTVEFTVERCGGTSSTDDDEDESDEIEFDTTPPQSNQNQPPAGTGSITAVGEPSFFESTGYLVLLTGLVLLLIIVIVAMLITNKK